MGFLSKTTSVTGVLFAAAIAAEQLGVTDKFVPTEKKDLVGKYVGEHKKLKAIKRSINKTLFNFKGNIATKSKVGQISLIEDDLIDLDIEYETYLENKVENINFTKKMLGDIFIPTAKLINVTDSVVEFSERYKDILNKILELDSNLKN